MQGSELQEIIIDIIQKLANPTPDLDQRQIIIQIDELKSKNFTSYLLSLSQIALNTKVQDQIRVLAVIQLKNSINSRSKKNMAFIHSQWNLMDTAVRNTIFANVFQLLELELFKTVAPTCLAYLCVMESKTNTWIQLVSQLQLNIMAEDSQVLFKQSSLTTLGYVAQEMSSYFNDDISSQILNAVAYAVTVSSLKKSASMTLYNVLDSIYEQVENKNFRDQVLKLIIQLTIANENSIEVRIKAYACLVKIADIYYLHLSEYIEGLFNLTVGGMSCKESSMIIMHSIEFWKAICQKEFEIIQLQKAMVSKNEQTNCTFYSKEALPHIIFTLLHHLKGNEGEQIEGWNPCTSAAHCLTKLAECWNDLVLEYVGQFFSEQIASSEWYCKNASVLALGSIVDELTKENLAKINPVVWQYLIECMNHPQSELRDTVCWVIGKISKADPMFIAQKKDELLPLLINRLDDEPKVIKNASIAITQTIESLKTIWKQIQDGSQHDLNSTNNRKNHQKQYFYTEDDFIRLIKMFLRNSQQSDISLTVVSFSSISVIINCIDEQMINVANFAFNACFEALESAYQFRQQSIISSVILTIQSIIDVFGSLNPKMCKDMMDVVYKMCQSGNLIEKLNILPDVLTLVTVIVSILNEKFIPFISLANKLIIVGLQEFLYDSDTCKAGIGLLSILSTFLPEKLIESLNNNQLESIMQSLFNIVRDQSEMGLPLKHHVIDCFGDLILAFGSKIFKFADNIIKTILEALQSDLAGDTDIYQYNYAVDLYCSCMNALCGIIQSMCKPNMVETRSLMANNLSTIINSLISITITFGSNEDIQMTMIGLIGDMCQCFPNEMVACINQPLQPRLTAQLSQNDSNKNFMHFFSELLKRVKANKNKDLDKICFYTLEQLKKAKIEVI